MRDLTRRSELGKMFIDIAKYVFTIVVIGGLFSGKMGFGAVALGIALATGAAATGFQIIPQEEEE